MFYRTKSAENKLSDRQQRIYTFLKQNPVGVLASITPEADPHAAVIYYDVDQHFVISFLTKTGTRKYDNMKHHPNIMLIVFDPKTQATVQVLGEAHEMRDGFEINKTAESVLSASMSTSDAGLPPISKLQAGDYTAFAVEPRQVRMAVYARPDSGEYSNLFESIESYELAEIT